MTQYSDIERQAGAMILSQLKMFNEAVVVFENQIDGAFWKGFDQCVDWFLKDKNWKGEAEYEQKEYCWLAPKSWEQIPDVPKYFFETHSTVVSEVDYCLAVITGIGTEQASFGFRFKVNIELFGGKRKFTEFVKNINPLHREQLRSLGFDALANGEFFFPVLLNANQLADCWQEYGYFPADHEIFSPLNNAMEKFMDAVPFFDEIFSSSFKNNE
ncbi:hypothetical protein [Pectobacterium polaris]|uniref:hypothetical protein n=1 Tax=Pectobacterium polaris TaxID=2042057 RepID=UPI000BB31664|nr:hypothetical protein [Pectobacterium polaris]ASY74423.1 hypothetical protein BJJ97_00080 [Pectobacterium polaris]